MLRLCWAWTQHAHRGTRQRRPHVDKRAGSLAGPVVTRAPCRCFHPQHGTSHAGGRLRTGLLWQLSGDPGSRGSALCPTHQLLRGPSGKPAPRTVPIAERLPTSLLEPTWPLRHRQQDRMGPLGHSTSPCAVALSWAVDTGEKILSHQHPQVNVTLAPQPRRRAGPRPGQPAPQGPVSILMA